MCKSKRRRLNEEEVAAEVQSILPDCVKYIDPPFSQLETETARAELESAVSAWGPYENWPLADRVDFRRYQLEKLVRDKNEWDESRLRAFYRQSM